MLEQDGNPTGDPTVAPEFDTVVIGAGLSGLRVLRELRDEVGLSVQVFEAGTDVGGDNPIEEITPKGILLEDGTEYEVDVIVFALGFNAITGALAAIDIGGRGGRSLGEKWTDGAAAYLGVAVDEFPNMFTILGPQSPFVNTPPMVERQVDFIGGAIRYMRDHDIAAIEVTAATVEAWNAECRTGLDATLIPKGLDDRPWFLRKIPGKPLNVLFYFGGFEAYCDEVEASLGNDLAGFTVT